MTMASVDDERVDIIDQFGNTTGTATRAEVRAGNLFHRSVFIAVVNQANELLVHRRAEWKDVWPGAWDLAFGGVVESGESWETAAVRELDEEAGVAAELTYLGEDVYEDETVRELARIYLARHDGPATFRDGEVVEATWVPIDSLRSWLEDREVCPDSRALVIPRLDAP
jgi:isopentenyldiphosphate isomerase